MSSLTFPSVQRIKLQHISARDTVFRKGTVAPLKHHHDDHPAPNRQKAKFGLPAPIKDIRLFKGWIRGMVIVEWSDAANKVGKPAGLLHVHLSVL